MAIKIEITYKYRKKIQNKPHNPCLLKTTFTAHNLMIACKALKSQGVNSWLCLIYAWFEIEQKITFIELYHKNDKVNEDRQRVVDNFK